MDLPLSPAWTYILLSDQKPAWTYYVRDEIVVAGMTESRGQKSDRRDAYGLAEKLRTGALAKRIFKAPREFSALRELSRMHITMVREVVRVQARIKSLYRSRGIPVAGLSVYGARHREEWQQRLPASARLRAAPLYSQLDFLVEQTKQIERDLLREAKKHPIVRILETAPGFRPIRSASLVSTSGLLVR